MNQWTDKPRDPARAVREYIRGRLPKSYTASPLFAVSVREEEGVCAARIVLDMYADDFES